MKRFDFFLNSGFPAAGASVCNKIPDVVLEGEDDAFGCCRDVDGIRGTHHSTRASFILPQAKTHRLILSIRTGTDLKLTLIPVLCLQDTHTHTHVSYIIWYKIHVWGMFLSVRDDQSAVTCTGEGLMGPSGQHTPLFFSFCTNSHGSMALLLWPISLNTHTHTMKDHCGGYCTN